MYKPLPDSIVVGKSSIHGYGLIAVEFIPYGTKLGLSHVLLGECIIRTPLGGFINHSDAPNCVKTGSPSYRFLETISDIDKGEELTVRYTLYKLTEPIS